MEYPLASNNMKPADKSELKEFFNFGRFSMGQYTKKFESELNLVTDRLYNIAVNSGSSANLLAAATAYELGEIYRSCDVIVPALGWSTTYFPFHQYGCRLIFIDVYPDTWTLNYDILEDFNLDKRFVRGIVPVNVLGCPPKNIRNIENSVTFYDNCEGFHSSFIDRKYLTFKPEYETNSFYFSHHIQTFEGGSLLVEDYEHAKVARSIRSHGWNREDNDYQDTFENKFKFSNVGYNIRPQELSMFYGYLQLKRLDEIMMVFYNNGDFFRETFGKADWCEVQKTIDLHSYMGLGFTLSGKLQGRRDIVVNALQENKIECRPIISGNFTKQPVFKKMNTYIHGHLPVTNNIHENGIMIGNGLHVSNDHINFAYDVINEVSKRF